MTFDVQVSEGEEITLETVVFQAMGRASTCWESMEGTGVFDDASAKEVGDYVVDWVRKNYFPVDGIPTGDFVDLGPGLFSNHEKTVINWRGDNFYKACSEPVWNDSSGTTHCTKPLNHPSLSHEDYQGRIRTLGRLV